MLTDISTWPTSLQFDNKNDGVLVCEKSLRYLPGKRLVCCGNWQEKPVVAKLFLDRRSAKRHWDREKSGAELLAKRGIVTPSLLFSGHLNDGTPLLLFEQLPGAETALDIWQQVETDQQRHLILHQLLAVIASHHCAGLWQADLHLDNFLRSDGVWYTIDADSIRSQQTGTPLDLKRSVDNLALFFAQLFPQHDHLIAAALNEYGRIRQIDRSELYNSLKGPLDRTRKRRRDKYIKKSYRSCTEFVRQSSFRRTVIYRRDADPERIRQLLADPDRLVEAGSCLKDGNSATVAHIPLPDGDWIIKRYNIKNLWHGLKRCLRPSRAWISWGNAHRLAISGIATPRAIAVIEKRFGPLRLGAYYICEHVEGVDAERFFRHDGPENGAGSPVAGNFVTLFDICKRIGIYHGDCKATNFLISGTKIWVIDLDAMREFKNKNIFLRRFRSDRTRFLQNWQDLPKLHQWFDDNLPE